MNKKELKSFAVEARRDLREKVALKAEQFGITETNQALEIKEDYGQLIVNNKTFPVELKQALHTLKKQIDAVGYNQLIEEVAYTWFNRIIAIRYMEVNNYLPDRVNVLSSSTGKNEPDILVHYETMNLNLSVEDIASSLREGNQEEAYRKLFVAQCNSLNQALPMLFEEINDYTELLLPDYLLDSEFIINKLVSNDELTNSFEEVEVIGWLYQYYNAEPKDQVFKKLKKNKKIEKFDIPAATQLFTPNWIVRYMIENSLGQIWLESNPDSTIKDSFEFYIEPTSQSEEVTELLDKVKYHAINIEELTLIDPCVGSGHILIQAFDLFYKMYEELGYIRKDIPQLILEKNLVGLDIDQRATQMASFALFMKARQKSRRIFNHNIKLNILPIEESNSVDKDSVIALLAKNQGEATELKVILESFIDAKNLGSIIQSKYIDTEKYLERINSFDSLQITMETQDAIDNIDLIKSLLMQYKLITCQYDVAVTNPPYMGRKGMNTSLKKYLAKNYEASKADLFSVFLERLQLFTKTNGINSSVTQHSWMFLSSFEKLKSKLLEEQTILSLGHLGTRAFDDIGGEVVQTAMQTFRKAVFNDYVGTYLRLTDLNTSESKMDSFHEKEYIYTSKQKDFTKIPGSPIAYWISPKEIDVFKNDKIEIHATACTGMQTGNNPLFIRNWYEVDVNKTNIKDSLYLKWFKYNEGGESRKWYGNHIGVVNWENNGEAIKRHKSSVVRNEKYFFKEGITWKRIGSGNLALRYLPSGFIFDQSGDSLFVNEYENLYFILGFFNSKVAQIFKQILAPTMNLTAGNIKFFPIIFPDNAIIKEVSVKVLENIEISKRNWDYFEISWDFKKHQLIKNDSYVWESFAKWNVKVKEDLSELRTNEEIINHLFITLYELEDKISPEVSEDDLSIELIDKEKNVKSFLSYFIGCLVGRYSLDVEGLAYAGGEFDESKYQSFKPVSDGVVQLTDAHYFDDDIIARLREFLSVAFSPDKVDENMAWLAESLEMKKNESPEERLRRYFLDEFFKDHCQTYQKRPIYWLVDSGKQKGLRTLIYMHRYQPDTMATIRFEHLQEIQSKYQNEIDMIDTRLANPSLSASDKNSFEKSKINYQKKLDELQTFDKKLASYANEQIAIDLDDGVKVNYAKFDEVLAKIK